MPPSPKHQAALSPDWTAVADGIQRALAEALAQAADRDRILETNPVFSAAPAPITDGARRLDERLQAFAACVYQSEQTAAEVEALLETGRHAIDTWRAAADSFRQKLAKWSSHSL